MTTNTTVNIVFAKKRMANYLSIKHNSTTECQ